MMNAHQIYAAWRADTTIAEDDRIELQSIADAKTDIEDRFYQMLPFGTAGLRGIMGMGTNRMNIYILKMVTQGLANDLKKHANQSAIKVAIAHDSRRNSDLFMRTTATVLAANGIEVHVFAELMPTPMLSFAVRELKCQAGVVITASHNPKDYNGYKIYDQSGTQISAAIAARIKAEIEAINHHSDAKNMAFDEAFATGRISYIPTTVTEKYEAHVLNLALSPATDKDIKVVFSPLHGAGNIPVRRVLQKGGYHRVTVVPEQEHPDGNFPTTEYPNPEDTAAFSLAIKLGRANGADLLIATDPDCDRIAAMIKAGNGAFVALNGNQIGALLIHYLLSQKNDKGILPANGAIVKSVVTNDFGATIAKAYAIKTIEVLTGFKNICGIIPELENKLNLQYLFGYEESIGFNPGKFVRDKDAVAAAFLLVEMAAHYKQRHQSLLDVLEYLYETHGYFADRQLSLVREGKTGQEAIGRIMNNLRKNATEVFANSAIHTIDDYLAGTTLNVKTGITVPHSGTRTNLLIFRGNPDFWFAIRPSGTEPKIKLYIYGHHHNKTRAMQIIANLEEMILDKIKTIEESGVT
jgi:phosphoglucomutase